MIPDIVKRWAVMVVVALAVGVFGFVKGMGYEQTRNEAKLTAGVVYVAKKTAEAQQVADTHGEKNQKAQDKVRVVYKTLIQKEIEYVQSDPTADTVLPVGFVRRYNAASLACDLAEPACGIESEPTGQITLADLIHQYNQVGEFYQTCRIANEGWEDFYAELKAKINKDQPNGDTE